MLEFEWKHAAKLTETKIVRKGLAVALQRPHEFDKIMEKNDYWKASQITACVSKFPRNCKKKRAERTNVSLTSEESKIQVEI